MKCNNCAQLGMKVLHQVKGVAQPGRCQQIFMQTCKKRQVFDRQVRHNEFKTDSFVVWTYLSHLLSFHFVQGWAQFSFRKKWKTSLNERLKFDEKKMKVASQKSFLHPWKCCKILNIWPSIHQCIITAHSVTNAVLLEFKKKNRPKNGAKISERTRNAVEGRKARWFFLKN